MLGLLACLFVYNFFIAFIRSRQLYHHDYVTFKFKYLFMHIQLIFSFTFTVVFLSTIAKVLIHCVEFIWPQPFVDCLWKIYIKYYILYHQNWTKSFSVYLTSLCTYFLLKTNEISFFHHMWSTVTLYLSETKNFLTRFFCG